MSQTRCYLHILAINLIGLIALLALGGCADPNSDTRQFYERLDRQSGGSSL